MSKTVSKGVSWAGLEFAPRIQYNAKKTISVNQAIKTQKSQEKENHLKFLKDGTTY